MNPRTPFIAGNWKMHKTGSQAVEAASQLKALVEGATNVEVSDPLPPEIEPDTAEPRLVQDRRVANLEHRRVA